VYPTNLSELPPETMKVTERKRQTAPIEMPESSELLANDALQSNKTLNSMWTLIDP